MNFTSEISALSGLAASAFLSATILPLSSEGVLLALALAKAAPDWLLLAVASIANTAGSCLNWLLGRFLTRLRATRWFSPGEVALDRAERWYAAYGWPTLLLSWAPIVGDPLTVVAGLLRTPFWLFVIVVGCAKTGRYAAILWAAG